MSLSAAVGSFDITTGTADVVVTGLGFQPKAIIFFWNGRTGSVDAVGDTDIFRGFGFTAGVGADRCVCSNADDTNTVSDSNSASANDACIANVSLAAAVDGKAALKTFDSGGFTLQINDAFPVNFHVGYLALGGDDITNASVGTFNEPAATGTQDITDAGFQPDIVCIIHSTAVTAAAGATNLSGGIAMGWAKSSTERFVYTGISQGNGSAAADTDISCRGAQVVVFVPDGAGNVVDARADFVSMLSNGFQLNWAERISTRTLYYLALKGGGYFIGNFLTSTVIDTDIVESGLGFQPKAVLCVSGCQAETADNVSTANDELSVGAFTSTSNRLAFGTNDTDGAAAMQVGSASEFDSCYVAMTAGDNHALEALVDVQSIDSDGFTLNQDDADAVAAFVGYVAFGDTPAAPTGHPAYRRYGGVPFALDGHRRGVW